MALFVYKPTPMMLVQWNGSNLSELESAFPFFEFILDGGVLTCNGNTLDEDAWLGNVGGPYTFTPAQVDELLQEYTEGDGYVFESAIVSLDIPERRTKNVAVPALLLGATQTLTVTWPTAMPSAAYTINVTPMGSSTIVGQMQWSVVQSSITATGLQIQVKGLLAVTVGTITLKVDAVEL